MKTLPSLTWVAVCAVVAVSAAGFARADDKITVEMLDAAQTEWCARLIAISEAHREGEDAEKVAVAKLEELYNFDDGDVLFKPTLTHGDQTFRPTKDAALAYFVGGNSAYPGDTGFALNPFVSARHKIRHHFIHDDVAITMGNVWIKDKDGNEVMVDKTFAYLLDDGKLQIVAHHSSLPYTPPAAADDAADEAN